MEPLNLPAYDFEIQEREGKTAIFDPIRRKFVRLTPEEWVRQHFVQYLIQELGYRPALLAVEAGFTYQRMQRRADLVVYDRSGRPMVMVECKAPEVAIQQATFDQVARYNKVVQARYLMVTNGREHYCYQVDYEDKSYRFLDRPPAFEEL